MKKKLIARISNGIGNQMFLYAASYALAKKNKYDLFLDIYTGINHDINRNKKKIFKHYNPKYELDIFNLTANILDKSSFFQTKFEYIKRKIYIFLDQFYKNKKFIIEKKNLHNKNFFNEIMTTSFFSDQINIEGYFECEKYFIDYRSDILKEFSFNHKIRCNNKYYNDIVNSNSVSLAFRRNRFTEKYDDDSSIEKITKTKKFEVDQFNFIIKSIYFFKKKIKNPKFFLFSDSFDNLENTFSNISDIIFVKDFLSNKVLEDFYLMYNCKHFAIAPTTFHWWAAWLNNNNDKICLRPSNSFLNPSNNDDFWPDSWLKI